MAIISNDPSWWPVINAFHVSSFFVVVSTTGVMYDWVLTFGQEVELIWRQRWSLMTVLYLCVRYFGISYAALNIILYVPTIPVTDVGCHNMYFTLGWMGWAISIILGVILITRLHAMYQRSRKVLRCLVVIFLAVNIPSGVILGIVMRGVSVEEFILSGTYQCIAEFEGEAERLYSILSWVLGATWEVFALSFAVWIAVKHFRELRQASAGGIIESFYTVLMKTHIVYFASFVVVSCFSVVYFSPTFSANTNSLGGQIYLGTLEIFTVVQMFVLGPRLILGVREYHAKLKADSDAAIAMASFSFQERVHVPTSSSV